MTNLEFDPEFERRLHDEGHEDVLNANEEILEEYNESDDKRKHGSDPIASNMLEEIAQTNQLYFKIPGIDKVRSDFVTKEEPQEESLPEPEPVAQPPRRDRPTRKTIGKLDLSSIAADDEDTSSWVHEKREDSKLFGVESGEFTRPSFGIETKDDVSEGLSTQELEQVVDALEKMNPEDYLSEPTDEQVKNHPLYKELSDQLMTSVDELSQQSNEVDILRKKVELYEAMAQGDHEKIKDIAKDLTEQSILSGAELDKILVSQRHKDAHHQRETQRLEKEQERESQRLDGQIFRLEEKINELKEESKTYERIAEEAQQSANGWKEQYEGIIEEIARAREETNSVTQKYEESRRETTLQRNQVAQKEVELSELQQEYDKLGNEYKKLIVEAEQEKQRASGLERRVKTETGKVDRIQKEKLRTEAELSEKIQQYEGELAQAKEEMQRMEARLKIQGESLNQTLEMISSGASKVTRSIRRPDIRESSDYFHGMVDEALKAQSYNTDAINALAAILHAIRDENKDISNRYRGIGSDDYEKLQFLIETIPEAVRNFIEGKDNAIEEKVLQIAQAQAKTEEQSAEHKEFEKKIRKTVRNIVNLAYGTKEEPEDIFSAIENAFKFMHTANSTMGKAQKQAETQGLLFAETARDLLDIVNGMLKSYNERLPDYKINVSSLSRAGQQGEDVEAIDMRKSVLGSKAIVGEFSEKLEALAQDLHTKEQLLENQSTYMQGKEKELETLGAKLRDKEIEFEKKLAEEEIKYEEAIKQHTSELKEQKESYEKELNELEEQYTNHLTSLTEQITILKERHGEQESDLQKRINELEEKLNTTTTSLQKETIERRNLEEVRKKQGLVSESMLSFEVCFKTVNSDGELVNPFLENPILNAYADADIGLSWEHIEVQEIYEAKPIGRPIKAGSKEYIIYADVPVPPITLDHKRERIKAKIKHAYETQDLPKEEMNKMLAAVDDHYEKGSKETISLAMVLTEKPIEKKQKEDSVPRISLESSDSKVYFEKSGAVRMYVSMSKREEESDLGKISAEYELGDSVTLDPAAKGAWAYRIKTLMDEAYLHKEHEKLSKDHKESKDRLAGIELEQELLGQKAGDIRAVYQENENLVKKTKRVQEQYHELENEHEQLETERDQLEAKLKGIQQEFEKAKSGYETAKAQLRAENLAKDKELKEFYDMEEQIIEGADAVEHFLSKYTITGGSAE